MVWCCSGLLALASLWIQSWSTGWCRRLSWSKVWHLETAHLTKIEIEAQRRGTALCVLMCMKERYSLMCPHVYEGEVQPYVSSCV